MSAGALGMAAGPGFASVLEMLMQLLNVGRNKNDSVIRSAVPLAATSVAWLVLIAAMARWFEEPVIKVRRRRACTPSVRPRVSFPRPYRRCRGRRVSVLVVVVIVVAAASSAPLFRRVRRRRCRRAIPFSNSSALRSLTLVATRLCLPFPHSHPAPVSALPFPHFHCLPIAGARVSASPQRREGSRFGR